MLIKEVLQADGNLNLQEGMKNIRNVLKYFYTGFQSGGDILDFLPAIFESSNFSTSLPLVIAILVGVKAHLIVPFDLQFPYD